MSIYLKIETKTNFNQPDIELKYILYSIWHRWYVKPMCQSSTDENCFAFECILFQYDKNKLDEIINEIKNKAFSLNLNIDIEILKIGIN